MPPANRKLTAVNLPVGAVLKRREEYTFEYKIDSCIRYAIIYNGEWHFALREGEDKYSFSGFYDVKIDKNGLINFKLDCPAPGSIKIVAQPDEGDSFGSFLEYIVE